MGDTRVGTCVGETYQVTCAQTFHGYLLECVETVKLRRTAEHGVYKVGGTFLTVCLQVPDGFVQRGTVYQSQHFFGCMLQELAVVLCLDVHIILPLLAIYKVRGKQAERDLLQCAFGLGYVDEIVESAADVFNLTAVNIGNIGYTGIDIAVYSIAERQELGEVRHQCCDNKSTPQQPVTDAVEELCYKLYYIHKILFPFDYFYICQHLK